MAFTQNTYWNMLTRMFLHYSSSKQLSEDWPEISRICIFSVFRSRSQGYLNYLLLSQGVKNLESVARIYFPFLYPLFIPLNLALIVSFSPPYTTTRYIRMGLPDLVGRLSVKIVILFGKYELWQPRWLMTE